MSVHTDYGSMSPFSILSDHHALRAVAASNGGIASTHADDDQISPTPGSDGFDLMSSESVPSGGAIYGSIGAPSIPVTPQIPERRTPVPPQIPKRRGVYIHTHDADVPTTSCLLRCSSVTAPPPPLHRTACVILTSTPSLRKSWRPVPLDDRSSVFATTATTHCWALPLLAILRSVIVACRPGPPMR